TPTTVPATATRTTVPATGVPATATRTPTAVPAAATSTPLPTATTAPTSGSLTVAFDDHAGQNTGLNGQYPSGVINWGSGAWYLSAPWGRFNTKSTSFANGSISSASFTLTTPRRLVSLQAYNGGGSAATVTITCPGQPTTQV